MKNLINTIQKFENLFLKAGEMAVKMQASIKPDQKLGTGIYEIDVVTKADLEIQEFILAALSKTSLSECQLIAEEDTPYTRKFNPDGEVILSVDPIDGTFLYAEGKNNYGMVIGLQQKAFPVYTFNHYPATGWTQRFVADNYSEIGPRFSPEILIKDKNIISYTYGNPKEKISEQMYKELIGKGYRFIPRKEISPNWGSTVMFTSGKVDGVYYEPSVVDGMVALHYGLTNGCKVYNFLKDNIIIDQSNTKRYEGFYIVLR